MMAAAAIFDNFEWPYLRNGPRSTYIARDDSAHRAVIFATARAGLTIWWALRPPQRRGPTGKLDAEEGERGGVSPSPTY